MFSLITGANGFIGSHLAPFLVERGERVRALVRPQSDVCSLASLRVEFAYGDLREADSLPSALTGVQRVYHVAAERGQSGARHILGDRNLTLKRVFEILSALSGRPMPRLRLPYAVPYLASLADSLAAFLSRRPPRIPLEAVRLARHNMFVDCSNAKNQLGFQPGLLEPAIEGAVRWYRDKGYVKQPFRTAHAVHAQLESQ